MLYSALHHHIHMLDTHTQLMRRLQPVMHICGEAPPGARSYTPSEKDCICQTYLHYHKKLL